MESSGFAANIVPSAWLGITSKMPFLSTISAQGAHSILDPYGMSSLHAASSGRFWYTLSASPTSAARTAFTCHIYLNWPGDNAQADVAIQAIQDEVQALLGAAKSPAPMKALDAAAGRGLQKGILDEMTKHLKEERREGKEVWPASRESSVSEKYSQADLRKSHLIHLLRRREEEAKYGRACFRPVLTKLLTVVCKQLSCLKTTKPPDLGLWERLGPRNELDW